MDKDFSWNLRGASPETMALDASGYNAAQAAAALAGAMPSSKAQLPSQEALEAAKKYAEQMEAARKAQEDAIALQAQKARWLQLENKFAQRTMNPKMKMAAMLAMAGQPGALQQMFVSDGTNTKEVQSAMDSLESSIANDMFALAGADQDTFAKLTGAILPLYKSKFDELISKGAKSRMGEDWDKGWGAHFQGMLSTRSKRKADAEAKKGKKSGLGW